MSNGNWWLIGAVGTIAAVGVGYYYLRARSNRPLEEPKLKPSLSVSTDVQEEKPVSAELVDLAVKASAPPKSFERIELLSELRSRMSELREEDLQSIKEAMDALSFRLSEWLFYYDLRTKKSISWNPETGMINETSSPAEKDVGTRIARTMRKAYWDMHYEEICRGDYEGILARLEELQARIQSFQPRNKKEPVFDMEYIRREALGARFDSSLFNAIIEACVSSMERLESPASHEVTVNYFSNFAQAVAAPANPIRDMVDALAFLFSQLDVLETEVKNFKASQVQPIEKMKLEREAFLALLTEIHMDTPVLNKTIIEPLVPSDRVSLAATDAAVVKNLKKVILDFLQTHASPIIPESMIPSAEVLESFASSVNKTVYICAFLVCMDSQIGEKGRRILNDNQTGSLLVSQLWDMCGSTFPVSKAIDHTIAILLAGDNKVAWNVETITTAVEQCCNEASPIYQLYKRRVYELIIAGVTNNKIDVLTTALGSKPWHLSLLTHKLSNILSEVLVFLASHMQVYRDVYRQLATVHSG